MQHGVNEKHFWFKKKKFSWGWRPGSWQAWSVTLLYALAVAWIAHSTTTKEYHEATDVIRHILVPVGALTFAYIMIAWRTGEPLTLSRK